MVMVAHFVSEDNVLKHVVLDLVKVEGTHEGKNLASVVLKVLDEWGVVLKLGFFVMDNATNNDTMMEKISYGALIPFETP